MNYNINVTKKYLWIMFFFQMSVDLFAEQAIVVEDICDGLQYISFSDDHGYKIDPELPKILYTATGPGCGGAELHTLNIYENFLKKGYDAVILASDKSVFEEELVRRRLAYYKTDALKYPLGSKDLRDALRKHIYKISQSKDIQIIHSNKPHEYKVVSVVANNLNIWSLANYHCATLINPHWFMGIDFFVGANPGVCEEVEKLRLQKKLDLKLVKFIIPTINEEKFFKFNELKSNMANIDFELEKRAFFKASFGIELSPIPLICMVANFYPCKNHELVLKAMHKLIYEKNFPVQIALVGLDSYNIEAGLKEQAKKLKLENYVYFLGFTNDVPSVLYYSDAKILPSLQDAFPMVVIEAALMKKPIIVSNVVGSANVIIKHGQTGLICDPNDDNDLAEQIKRLLQDSSYAANLGDNAYNLVVENFSLMSCLSSFEEIYKLCCKKKVHKSRNIKYKR